MVSTAADDNAGGHIRWASKVTPIKVGDAIIIGVDEVPYTARGGCATAIGSVDLLSLDVLWPRHYQRLVYVHGKPVAIRASSMGTPYLNTYNLARDEYCNREEQWQGER